MLNVRKFEFISTTGKFSVVERPVETSAKQIPKGEGRFIRTWIGTAGTYSVKMLKESTSKFVQLLCEKGGFLKIKKGEHKSE
jgi:hypothetical protein